MKREQRNSLILAAVFLVVFGAVFLVQRFLLRSPEDAAVWAVVQVSGRDSQRLALTKDVEFRLGDDETGWNLIRVEEGKILVAEADCPDEICVHTGAISQPGQVIACLPHGLLIYIEEAGEQE